MKLKLLLLLITATSIAMSQTNNVGIFKNHADIGNPAIKGEVQYDAGTQAYTIKGSGYNVWFNRDEFQYAYN